MPELTLPSSPTIHGRQVDDRLDQGGCTPLSRFETRGSLRRFGEDWHGSADRFDGGNIGSAATKIAAQPKKKLLLAVRLAAATLPSRCSDAAW